MEVLHDTLKNIEIKSLSYFELKVWGILCSLFENLIVGKFSCKSSIDKGLGIEIFLRIKKSDFVLYMSIAKNRFYINSKYFDFYLYPDTEIAKIELLLRQVLLGKYTIKLGYDNNGKLVYKELYFENIQLEEFNESKKIGFFSRNSKIEKQVDGIRLIKN